MNMNNNQTQPMTHAEITLNNCRAIVDHERILAEHTKAIRDLQLMLPTPEEYPPVNFKEANRLRNKALAMCHTAQRISIYEGLNHIHKEVQESIVNRFSEQLGVSLLAELEEAKKWYQYQYRQAKENSSDIPKTILKPTQIRNLSLYSIVSTNPAWIKHFDRMFDEPYERFIEGQRKINEEYGRNSD